MCESHQAEGGGGGCGGHGAVPNPSVLQTLDEMEFERGIWAAAQSADLDRVRTLLSKGTPVDKLDAAGYTALHYAARAGHEDMVSELLRAGADINARTHAGRATPLHRAASAGRTEIVKMLLSRNANTDLVDADGRNALHRAAEAQHAEICKLLLTKNRLLMTAIDNRGNIPVDLAPTNPIILQIFTEK